MELIINVKKIRWFDSGCPFVTSRTSASLIEVKGRSRCLIYVPWPTRASYKTQQYINHWIIIPRNSTIFPLEHTISYKIRVEAVFFFVRRYFLFSRTCAKYRIKLDQIFYWIIRSSKGYLHKTSSELQPLFNLHKNVLYKINYYFQSVILSVNF